MTINAHYFSRSASDQDDNCRRARFWNTIYGGRGLESTDPKQNLDFGTYLHKGLQEIWETGKIDVHSHRFEGLPVYMGYLGRGLLFAYYNTVYQRYQVEGWVLIKAEQECKALIGLSPIHKIPLILLSKPDILIRHPATERVRYIEGKTSSTIDSSYMESWRYHPQLAAGFEGVWQTMGIHVDDFVMQIFYKGTWSNDYNRQMSVFTSGWYNPDKNEWAPKRPQSYKGWTRFDIPDVPELMPEAEWHQILLKSGCLEEQVPETPPLTFHKDMAEAWLEQKRNREGEIADTLVTVDSCPTIVGPEYKFVRTVWPQNFLKCRPYKGYPCNYLSLCWNPTETKNPLNSGKYMWRIPHHETEAEALNIKSKDTEESSK